MQCPQRGKVVTLGVLVLAWIWFLCSAHLAIASLGGKPNPIQIENANPGTQDWLLANPARNREIEGYASLTSVNAGDNISFFVNTSDPAYTLTIYRTGWYGGLGGRQMTQPVQVQGIQQAMPTPDGNTGLTECAWINPYVLQVPSGWVSGVYIAKLSGTVSAKQTYIPFVVRNDGRASDLLFQSSVTTFQAYNAWGGFSLYTTPPAVKVSFNRPYDSGQGASDALHWEFDMLFFLESEGYDVTYSTDVDTHAAPSELLRHKGFLSVGHDEYWSSEMRRNVSIARDRGVNLAFLGADACYWQIRFEPSLKSGDPYRTVVCYKDQWPQDPDAAHRSTYYLVTTAWRARHVTLPPEPEDRLVGVMLSPYEVLYQDIVIGNTSSWVFDNTGLKKGDHLAGLLGYEIDSMSASSQAGTRRLVHSPCVGRDGAHVFSDITIYRASSGAMVFATGTIGWSYGLSDISPWGPETSLVNPAAQQITRNVLHRFIGSPRGPALR